MQSDKQDHEGSRARFRRSLALLWWIALAVAAVNVLFVLRRAPILRQQNSIGDEAAVRTAASWLQRQPSDARLLLLRSRKDIGAVWFNYRLNYFIYPRRHDSAWELPPPDAASRYDLILAFGTVGELSNWIPIEHTGSVTLYAYAGREIVHAGTPPVHRYQPGIGGLSRAVFAVGVVLLLGILLLGWTCSAPPFKAWPANLAVAHLIGAAAMTWMVTISTVFIHRLTVWPVYILVLLLLPRIRRSAAIVFGNTNSKPVEPGGSAAKGAKIGLHEFAPIAVIALGIIAWAVNARFLGVGWDGYSIWQFKALAFLNDGNMSILRDPHYIDYAHFDYPLLVPLQTWWLGAHAGGYSEWWAHLTGALFTLDMIALFVVFGGRWVLRDFLLPAVAILVTLPVLTTHAVSGFADIEMAAYLLALGVFVSRVAVCDERSQTPVLIWLFAGIVLVKNEGILAALGGLAVLVAMQRRHQWGDMARCALAACLSCMPWLTLKRAWQLQNDLLESGKNPHFTLSLVLWRLGVAVKGFVLCIAQTGPRAGGWGLLVLILPVGLACTIRRRAAICAPLWLLCATQTAGYVLIYVITPHSLPQHIASSIDRLTLHLVPTMLLAALIGTFGKGLGIRDQC